jgi:hypothetical protein
METKPIQFAYRHAGTRADSDYRSAALAFAALRTDLDARRGAQGMPPSDDSRALASMLGMVERLDAQFGPDGPIALDGVGAALDEAMVAAVAVERSLESAAMTPATGALDRAVAALGLWAARHGVPVETPAPWVNALARIANAAATRQDCAAAFALMQGAVAHLAPALAADLERSDPQRPWRILILNLAITAIRAGEETLMRHAFDTLDAHLPLDAPGFYAEAAERALDPRFPAAQRALIDQRVARWTRAH